MIKFSVNESLEHSVNEKVTPYKAISFVRNRYFLKLLAASTYPVNPSGKNGISRKLGIA